jgi:transcriptional regulator with XRE-family HTH domain
MNIGRAIQQCRALKGLSMTDLAREADLSLSYLSLLEKGKRDAPNLTALSKISKALGIPLSLLIFMASEDENLSLIDDGAVDEIKRTTEYLLTNSHKESDQ